MLAMPTCFRLARDCLDTPMPYFQISFRSTSLAFFDLGIQPET